MTLMLAALQPVGAFASSISYVEVIAAPAASGSVARGAQRVPFLELAVTASCSDDAAIKSMRIRHEGKGSAADLARVYAVRDGVRISDSRTFSARDGRLTLRFKGASLEACDMQHIYIVGDLSADATPSGEHVLRIESSDDIDAGDMKVFFSTSTAADPIWTTPGIIGKVNAAFLPLLQSVRFGKNRTVARFTLTAEEKDQVVSQITLTNDGKASNEDLTNFSIVDSKGDRLTEKTASMDGKIVTLRFVPGFLLRKNATKLLQLRADVNASRKGTIRFVVEEPSDIIAAPGVRK